MNFLHHRTLPFLLVPACAAHGQSPNTSAELPLITATMMDYIDGSANGDPEQVRRAFHPDFNLYTVNDADSLWIRSGAKYIEGIKVGERNQRQGHISALMWRATRRWRRPRSPYQVDARSPTTSCC